MALEGLTKRLEEERDMFLAGARVSEISTESKVAYVEGLERAIDIISDYSAIIDDLSESLIHKIKESRPYIWTDSLRSKRSEIEGVKSLLHEINRLTLGSGGAGGIGGGTYPTVSGGSGS
jgi:hypothetical protein